MRRYLIPLSLGVLYSTLSYSQVKKQFSVKKESHFETVNFSFNLPSGTCYLSPKQNVDPINVYSNQEIGNYQHNFKKEINNQVYYVDINLEERESDSYGQSVSHSIFTKANQAESQLWKIYLSDDTNYDLNLHYGIGDAYLDLSGLAINKLHIQTGSANVNVGYLSEVANQVKMDTFQVKVDLGSLQIRRMDLSNASNVIADVGFGDLYLDYSVASKNKCQVVASVGAGDLVVAVPASSTPVIVKVEDSFLCRVKLAKGFKEIRDNVYVNGAYNASAENLMTFNLDVSMGNIIFKEK